MKPVVDIRHLSFAYRQIPVLPDISFQVAEGEFFIIIGPNGSGKTTLLKLIAGLVDGTGGRIGILDRPLSAYSRKALARRIAYVPQMTTIDFPFTVNELVMMGRAPHLGMLGIQGREDRAIVDQALEFTALTHLAQRKFSCLSGGECQRVFIARAICQQPRIILMDEPTAALDLAHQVRIMDLMERLKTEKGTTVIMVSHDLNLAAMYADRLLLMKNGTRVSLGTPHAVLKRPALQQTYGCALVVDENPHIPFPRVMPVPGRQTAMR